jgi:N-formylglutamate amidohydrolase
MLCVISVAACASAPAPQRPLRESAGSSLVLVQRGEVPILLTAPHGGTEAVPGVPVRSARSIPGGDPNTLAITIELAAELETILGAKPFVVAARFHRKYIDANRPPAKAYEDADAASHYKAYHDEIAASVAEMERRWPGRGFLLDVHGNSSYRGFLRGTEDGRTMARLIEKYGEEVVIGPRSVFGLLARAGHRVYPLPGKPISHPRERRRYQGGYTCSTYGARRPGGINAMQIECGEEIWTRWRSHPQFVVDLARALAGFHHSYLAGD